MPETMTREDAILRLNEANRRKAKNDCAFFIDTFVHVEDKDAVDTVTPFHLWEGQKKALDTFLNSRLSIVLKARQLGLTWLVLALAVWNMIYKSGYTILALSKKEDPDAKELIRRVCFILKYMPKWFIKKKGEDGNALLTWDNTALQVTVFHTGSEPSVFQSFAAAEDSGRSFTANLVILDEWAFQQWARQIWTAAYPTINRTTGGQLIGISTMERGTLFEEKYKEAMSGINAFARVFLPWNTDPRRDITWYENTKIEMKGLMTAEYPATEEEALSVPGGTFFSEFTESIHVKPPEEIPDYAQRYVSVDYGFDKLSVLWYLIDKNGNARIYRELAESNLIVSDAAKKVHELQTNSEGKEEHITAYLAPPDLIHSRHRETGKTTADIFALEGIYLTETSNNRKTGWLCVRELLKPLEETDEQTGEKSLTAKLTIDEGIAPDLKYCLLNIQRSKTVYNDVDGKGKPAHDLTHGPDSLRAFAIYWITPSGEPTEERRAKWTEDMYEDYYNCKNDEDRNYLLGIWGNPF